MEFTLSAFVESLRNEMYRSFPFEVEYLNQEKHPRRTGHIRDVAFKNNPTITLDENTLMFEIGNQYAEERYPYYHILQDAPYIRKRGQATSKTRGSQAKVNYLAKRDYNRVEWNGKTYTREYSKNIRGSRNRIGKVSYWATDYMGREYFLDRESNSYENRHFNYINDMLNFPILDNLAREFGLKRKRTQLTGLAEDYQAQTNDEHSLLTNMISEMMSSFEGD